MNRPAISPPVVAFLVAAGVVLAAAAAIPLPVPGLLLLLTVAWAAARGGSAAGMVSTAFAVTGLIAATTLDGRAFSAATATTEIAYTIGFVIVTYLMGGLKHHLDELTGTYTTLRTQADAAEEKHTVVLESITDGFLTLDPGWRISYVNRRGEQMLGRGRDKLIGRFILDAFPEGVGSTIHREMDRARQAMQPVEFEALYPAAKRWFDVRGYPAADGGMTVYFRDVTKRKRAQEALTLQARMLDTVRQPVIAVEPDGVIFYWNRAAEELFGWRADQVVGKTTVAVTQLDIDAASSERMLDRLRIGEPSSAETTLRRRDGSTFPALAIDAPIRGDDQSVLGMVRIVTDLSEQHAQQQAQRFLAEAGPELASTLDLEALMAAVALLCVPSLGDCCILDVVEEEGAARRIESAWATTRDRPAGRVNRRVHETEARAAQLLDKGGSALITRISDQVLRTLTAQPEELDHLRRCGVRSVVVAPLTARGRSLGTLAILSTQRVFNRTDAALFAEFARRVALAADNATLYESARLANQAKSDFLAVMSHELRTPLTTVMGYTDLMLAEVSGALGAQSQHYVERIRTAAWHLLGLIEQILIYTRVEVGREKVNIERIPIDYVLRDAAALIEPVAREKGLTFRLVPLEQAAYLDSDLTKLRQILLNLLSNAVKFTEHGEVELSACAAKRGVEFTVKDTGIGIAPEHLEHIFDSFWQVDQSSTRRVGGTGLGLSVARKLARLLGGEVWVISTPGVGTSFILELPNTDLPAATPLVPA